MIDWRRVRELQEEVGKDDFHEVVDLFLEEVDEVITRLQKAPDPKLYEDDFHFLKGCAVNLGFQSFAEICADFERSAADGKPDLIDPNIAIECFKTSRAQFLGKAAA